MSWSLPGNQNFYLQAQLPGRQRLCSRWEQTDFPPHYSFNVASPDSSSNPSPLQALQSHHAFLCHTEGTLLRVIQRRQTTVPLVSWSDFWAGERRRDNQSCQSHYNRLLVLTVSVWLSATELGCGSVLSLDWAWRWPPASLRTSSESFTAFRSRSWQIRDEKKSNTGWLNVDDVSLVCPLTPQLCSFWPVFYFSFFQIVRLLVYYPYFIANPWNTIDFR